MRGEEVAGVRISSNGSQRVIKNTTNKKHRKKRHLKIKKNVFKLIKLKFKGAISAVPFHYRLRGAHISALCDITEC